MRGKRGQGSVVPVAGGYQARWSRTEGGVRTRAAKTFAIRNDADWWLAQARRHGTAPEDLTVAEYLDEWVAAKRRASASTKAYYALHVRHINARLGGFRLTDLQRRHVEAFVEALLAQRDLRSKEDDPAKAKLLSPATAGKILATLRSALEAAVPRLIPDNPAERVEAPKVEREPVHALTAADARLLLDAVKGTWMERIVRVLLGSGMRLDEACALNQGDVHDGWVNLRRSKTTIRAVRLSADANAAIHDAIREAPRNGKREPVFFSPRRRKGLPFRDRLRGDSLTHGLPRRLEAAGLSRLTPHGLRHGTATLMVAAGVHMRVVAEQLGHANPAMTARVYAHVAPEDLTTAVSVLDRAVEA